MRANLTLLAKWLATAWWPHEFGRGECIGTLSEMDDMFFLSSGYTNKKWRRGSYA